MCFDTSSTGIGMDLPRGSKRVKKRHRKAGSSGLYSILMEKP